MKYLLLLPLFLAISWFIVWLVKLLHIQFIETDEQREAREEKEEMEQEYEANKLVFKKMSECYTCKNIQPYKNTKQYYGYCIARKEDIPISTQVIVCGRVSFLNRWEGEKRLPAVDYLEFKKKLLEGIK